MKKYILVFLISILVLPVLALNIGGVVLPDKIKIGEEELLLNGAGLRKKLVIKVYAGGLYLPQKNQNPSEILFAETAIAIRMHFIYKEVDSKSLIEAWNEGFANAGFEKIFASEIAGFNSLFNTPALKGDIYDIAYLPEIGIQVIRNGEILGTITNPAFRQAVFSIWLGENTALGSLKTEMLGGK